ncbi:DUF421 domain-containing protein [Pontibacter qinzhouensis]|uniref:DUF421 domain-containing protein n=1 Tax=Pontibacter qinzhouensis TaxID=2603253 RepID=A0A5C8KEH2_9BACT|nr:YetF domain-containing protein [Pontibacter qinzhouensis]TXK52637.1 DUF421 domain-containing protein [Pontibacter qinzhouensis]
MESQDYQITDIMRILVGEELPWIFLLEVVLRVFFIYLLIMLCMRLMGKRMASQLSNLEMSALVSLAAAVGVPILAPERGLLPAIIIALVVVVIQRIISHFASRSEKFESVTFGDLSVLITDGLMQLDIMKENRVTRERLQAELRSLGISNLGQVKRAYLETSGDFTFYLHDNPTPGLSLIPIWDTEMREKQKKAENHFTCNICGYLVTTQKATQWKCDCCGHKKWSEAVLTHMVGEL